MTQVRPEDSLALEPDLLRHTLRRDIVRVGYQLDSL
jgi:hypothetical protein